MNAIKVTERPPHIEAIQIGSTAKEVHEAYSFLQEKGIPVTAHFDRGEMILCISPDLYVYEGEWIVVQHNTPRVFTNTEFRKRYIEIA